MGAGGSQRQVARGDPAPMRLTSLGLTGSSAVGPGADGQAAVSAYAVVGPPRPRRGAELAGLASLPCGVQCGLGESQAWLPLHSHPRSHP